MSRLRRSPNAPKLRCTRKWVASHTWLHAHCLFTVLVATLSLSVGSLANAQPLVHVQAETRFELLYLHESNKVQGALRDALGVGLTTREIRITTQPLQPSGAQRVQRARTANDGAFSLQLPAEVRRWRIRIEYRGDSLYAPVRAERELNARLADVQLRIDVEDTIDLDSPSVALQVTAASTAGAHELEVVISDELGREFARGRVDAAGELEIRVEGAEFGAMGPGRIRVESMPDETRSGSRSERPVLRMRSATLSLERSEDRFGVESVNLHGLLKDSSGPLVARAVDLYLNDELSHTALTNADGRFVWSPNRLATGEHVFHAAFQSDTPGRPNIRSLPLEVSVTGAGSTRGLLYILALATAGLAAWRLRRRVMPPPPAAPIPAPEIPQLQLGKSRMTNRPSLCITGSIRDCITSAPLINASLSLDGEQKHQLNIDEDGTFQWTAPKAGEYTLELNLQVTNLFPAPFTYRIAENGHPPSFP